RLKIPRGSVICRACAWTSATTRRISRPRRTVTCEMLRMLPLVHAQAGQITLPLLIYHGEGDLLVPIGGSQRFHTEVGSPDRVFRSYPGGYHELHNDIDRQRVLTDLHSWLERHID
ncbi:MAG: serine aminopeptidase domain-containing protein, partial [Anaerolineae bacterium]